MHLGTSWVCVLKRQGTPCRTRWSPPCQDTWVRTHISLLDDVADHLPGTRLQAFVGQRLKAHLVAVEGGSLDGTVARGSEGHGDQPRDP